MFHTDDCSMPFVAPNITVNPPKHTCAQDISFLNRDIRVSPHKPHEKQKKTSEKRKKKVK